MKRYIFAMAAALCLLVSSAFGLAIHALEPEDELWIGEAREALEELTLEQDILATVNLCRTYDLKQQPDRFSQDAATIWCGTSVHIVDVGLDDFYQVWIKVRTATQDEPVTGYIEREKLACSDARFLQWEQAYGLGFGNGSHQMMSLYSVSVGDAMLSGNELMSTYEDINQFPESYRAQLDALKQQHENWVFVPMFTGRDWNETITEQLQNGRSLVHKSLPDYTKEGAYDQGSWFYASREILEYYMDPRNYLTESRIFAFEQLTFNESYHTEEAIQSYLKNTFMTSGPDHTIKAPGLDITYETIIYAVGRAAQVSPFHLASRILQEQGDGTSPMISGAYPGFEGYYNYLNIGATGKTNQEVIVNGLTYAKNAMHPVYPDVRMPWVNPHDSIYGGAYILAKNYISKGQDTLYLQKYNVQPGGTFSHQYMQNISAPYTEASSICGLYGASQALDQVFVFKIPVYESMPEQAVEKPAYSTNVVVEQLEGYQFDALWIDGVSYTPELRNGRAIVKLPDKPTDQTAETGDTQETQTTIIPAATTAVAYSYKASGSPNGMYLWTLEYQNNGYVVTPQPLLENFFRYNGVGIRVSEPSGIRSKTSISKVLREQLTTTGVEGYHLKEYGTLIIDSTTRPDLPLVKNGRGVMSGISYGYKTPDQFVDIVFEEKDERYVYTGVLTGVPAKYYNSQFQFRGYGILEKDGKEIIVYGPVRGISMKRIAEIAYDSGAYPADSALGQFLLGLIETAREVEEQSKNAE